MLKFNSIQPRNYKQMLKQAKQKQAYKSYIKQQRTQKIGHAYNAAKGTAQITKQASSNLFDKAKQLYNKRKQQMQPMQQPQLRNLYSNNPNQGTMLKFNSIQPKNYKQMLKQAKQKQEYKSYIKQQRTQKIGHAYNTAKGTAQITKQASSNLFNKVKQLYNKRKRVGYQKQY